MTVFLGIDGGGTGCRAAICDAAGRILGEGASGPANVATDPLATARHVMEAVALALPSGVAAEGLVAVLGLAGANVGTDSEGHDTSGLAARLPFARCRIVTDAVTTVVGALGEADGVVAALGTGSVFARQLEGRIVQIGGWGLVLGDEASGAWIGRALLARSLRALDGLVADSALLHRTRARFGGASGVVAFARDATAQGLAQLAPEVVGSDDPAALAIMDRAEAEVLSHVDALDPQGALPLVFAGGLGPAFACRLTGRHRVRPPLGTALDGALWMARTGAAP